MGRWEGAQRSLKGDGFRFALPILRILAWEIVGWVEERKPTVCSNGRALRIENFYPPAQKATGVNPWMNARWVPSVALAPGLRSRSDCFGGVGKEGALRPSPSEVGYGRRRSKGSARRPVWSPTAVRPWGAPHNEREHTAT